jgi:hypothetical protein
MKRPLIAVVVILIISIPLGMWWFSAEQVLKRRTQHLMDVMTISSGSAGPSRQAKVFSMNGLMADEVSITSPDVSEANGKFDKQEIESAFSWICQNAKRSQMKILDYRSVEIDGEKGRVEVLVECLLEMPMGTPISGQYLITIDWAKQDDGWRYEKVVAKKK